MATRKKPSGPQRPARAGTEAPDAPSPANVSGGAAALRVIAPSPPPDPEVAERAARRRFTAEYKRRVLQEADACAGAGAGELGGFLRREGLYSSHLTTWRRQREQGTLAALSPKKRGRPAAPGSPLARRVAELEREKARLEGRLKQAETIIEVQKKISEILGIPLKTADTAGSGCWAP